MEDQISTQELLDGDGESSAIRIALPYAISNVVFIQMIFAGLYCLGGGTSMATLVIGGLSFAVGWWALWRWALRGYKIAVIVVYAIYIPFTFAILLAIITVLLGPILRSTNQYAWIIPSLLAAFFSLLLICNMFEKGLWEFINLNNRCPSCKRWRFGLIRRPVIVTCPECGISLEFYR